MKFTAFHSEVTKPKKSSQLQYDNLSDPLGYSVNTQISQSEPSTHKEKSTNPIWLVHNFYKAVYCVSTNLRTTVGQIVILIFQF